MNFQGCIGEIAWQFWSRFWCMIRRFRKDFRYHKTLLQVSRSGPNKHKRWDFYNRTLVKFWGYDTIKTLLPADRVLVKFWGYITIKTLLPTDQILAKIWGYDTKKKTLLREDWILVKFWGYDTIKTLLQADWIHKSWDL